MVDKKSDHYTSATNYKDNDGNMKTFTFVDHDVKPNMSTLPPLSEEESADLKKTVASDIDRTIDEILALPAQSLLASQNGFAEDYVLRDSEQNKIVWREAMVRDALRINHNLRIAFRMLVWKHTIREQYWNESMSHEDILAGKWKDWI